MPLTASELESFSSYDISPQDIRLFRTDGFVADSILAKYFNSKDWEEKAGEKIGVITSSLTQLMKVRNASVYDSFLGNLGLHDKEVIICISADAEDDGRSTMHWYMVVVCKPEKTVYYINSKMKSKPSARDKLGPFYLKLVNYFGLEPNSQCKKMKSPQQPERSSNCGVYIIKNATMIAGAYNKHGKLPDEIAYEAEDVKKCRETICKSFFNSEVNNGVNC